MMKPAVAMLSSSPGHEKLPAPGFAGILAGSGSRSRGRAAVRTSPLFCSRSKSLGGSSAATQQAMAEAVGHEGEPISPKVTCIGQVRIRKKKSWSPPPPPKASPRSKDARKPWQCFHKILLCNLFAGRKKTKGWLSWRKWSPSGQYQRREPDSPRAPPLQFIAIRGDEEEEIEAAKQPPNNALLLMRCRSAPHNRASSLAASVRCAISPLPEQYLQKTAPAATKKERDKGACGEKRSRTKTKGNERWCQLAATAEMSEEEEEEETGSESQRPLVLTRSRSEPAGRSRQAGSGRPRNRASTRRASTVV